MDFSGCKIENDYKKNDLIWWPKLYRGLGMVVYGIMVEDVVANCIGCGIMVV